MKIFSSEQIQNADRFTIENEPISSINLMERAAQKCSEILAQKFSLETEFHIFCGNGNNGGDGLGIARLLYLQGYDVMVYVDMQQSQFSRDSQINFSRLKEILGIEIKDFSEINSTSFSKNSVIVDAVFGSGLNRPLSGNSKKLIDYLNTLLQYKISIDIPSGLFCDHIVEDGASVFNADETLSFQFWKTSFLHPETGRFCGIIHILDIGLSPEFIKNEVTKNLIVDDEFIKKIYRPRNNFSHKGNFGKTCIVAGSYGKIGAAVLATKAALKTGSGITFVQAPKCGYEILQISCPEAIFIENGEKSIENIQTESDFTYGIGPGLGLLEETESALLNFLKSYNRPLVLDADALNILAKNPDFFEFLPAKTIITPHPKEFERLFGKTQNSYERLDLAKMKAKELDIFIVLKDHHTQIVTPRGEVFYNITGNSGMAKGGSGDALLGIITSLLSQNYTPENSAIFGVWLHGKAGDSAVGKISKEAMLPSDLIDNLGEVFLTLQNNLN